MKNKRLIESCLVLLCVLISIMCNAQSNSVDWLTYSIPDVCSFKIPQTMEVRSDESAHGRFVKSMQQSSFFEMLCDECDLYFDETTLVIQPKGLNSNPFSDEFQKANNSYARIMLEFSYCDLSQEDVVGLSPSDLTKVSDIWEDEARRDIDCIDNYVNVSGSFKWFPIKIETYSGLKTMVSEYNRPGFGGETRVRDYRFFFNNKYLRVITSYKLNEETKYKEDFKTFVKSLKIEKADKQNYGVKQSRKLGQFSSREHYLSFSYDKSKYSEVKKQNKTSHCFCKLEGTDGTQILFSAWDQGMSTDMISIHDNEFINEFKQAEKGQDYDIINSCEKVFVENVKALKTDARYSVMGIEYHYTTYRVYYKNWFYTLDFYIPVATYNKNKNIVNDFIKGLKFN